MFVVVESAFQLIATDGGLLSEPVALSRIQLSPGERVELVVALDPGENVTLRSLPITERAGIDRAGEFGFDDTFDILTLRATATLRPSAVLPTTLIPPIRTCTTATCSTTKTRA